MEGFADLLAAIAGLLSGLTYCHRRLLRFLGDVRHLVPLSARSPGAVLGHTLVVRLAFFFVAIVGTCLILPTTTVSDSWGSPATTNESLRSSGKVINQSVDLLITEIGLPGLNGRQLADVVRTEQVGLKTLFMAGYAETATSSIFLQPGMEIISKPFNMGVLGKRVQ